MKWHMESTSGLVLSKTLSSIKLKPVDAEESLFVTWLRLGIHNYLDKFVGGQVLPTAY